MKKNFLILSILSFCILTFILIGVKISPYHYNLSALLGIWQGFVDLNPGYIPKDFIVFQNGGYDGQFFFILARYIYEDNLNFPVLDSFYFRFHRIGLSLLVGFLCKFLGFEFYPLLCLAILLGLHIFSFSLLCKLLPEEKYAFSLIYLFNPYSLAGILLLVADPLLLSLGTIAIFFIYRAQNSKRQSKSWIGLSVIFFSFSLLVRETSFFIILPLILYFAIKKEFFKILPLAIPLVFYTAFLIYTQLFPVPHKGTLPLRFIDMVDYPLFGFFSSLKFVPEDAGFLKLVKTGLKLFLFGLYLQLGCNLLNVSFQLYRTIRNHSFSLKNVYPLLLLSPAFLTFLVITIAEQGYWNHFDNIVRMFTLSLPPVLIAKAWFPGYKDYGFLYSSIALTFFISIRVIWITKPMSYVLN